MATLLFLAVTCVDINCKPNPGDVQQRTWLTHLIVRHFSRHDYDIPLLWINSAYIKVKGSSTQDMGSADGRFEQKLFVIDVLAGPSYLFAKASLFLLYYRIFALKKLMRKMIICGIAFGFVVYVVVNLPLVSTLCAPPAGGKWSFSVLITCRRALAFGVVQAVSNVALDLFILILPIPAIVQLQLPMNQKIGVFAIFLTGLL